MKTIAIFGYGYVAKFLVREFLKNYNIIVVSRRSEAIKDTLLIPFGDDLLSVDAVISTIPPVNGIDPVLERYKFECWAAYCSTTGVYGDHQGNWVNEESDCLPTNERGQQRLAIEKQWLGLPNSCILRLAGIYGPGRSALDQINNSNTQRINKPGHVFSRIHVEDIAGFSAFAFERDLKGIFNLADKLPAPSKDVLEYACDLIKKPYPPLVEFDRAVLSPMAQEFYKDSKKVDSKKIIESGYSLRFQDYKSGLDSIIQKNPH